MNNMLDIKTMKISLNEQYVGYHVHVLRNVLTACLKIKTMKWKLKMHVLSRGWWLLAGTSIMLNDNNYV